MDKTQAEAWRRVAVVDGRDACTCLFIDCGCHTIHNTCRGIMRKCKRWQEWRAAMEEPECSDG